MPLTNRNLSSIIDEDTLYLLHTRTSNVYLVYGSWDFDITTTTYCRLFQVKFTYMLN